MEHSLLTLSRMVSTVIFIFSLGDWWGLASAPSPWSQGRGPLQARSLGLLWFVVYTYRVSSAAVFVVSYVRLLLLLLLLSSSSSSSSLLLRAVIAGYLGVCRLLLLLLLLLFVLVIASSYCWLFKCLSFIIVVVQGCHGQGKTFFFQGQGKVREFCIKSGKF